VAEDVKLVLQRGHQPHHRPSREDDDGGGGGRLIAEEVDVVVHVA